MPIRIAYIVDSFSKGGLERCVARLVNGLSSDEFEPCVICLRKSGAAEEWIERSDVPVIEINRREGNDLRAMRKLADVLKSERIELVHSHNWATLLETTVARSMAKTPVHVHAQRGMFFHAAKGWLKSMLRRQVTRWCIRRANCLVVVDDSVKDYWLTHFGGARTEVRVITNGVDIPAHDASGKAAESLRESLGISADAVVVGSVGRLVPVKSFETLIGSASLLRKAGTPVEVVLVGEGETRAQLMSTAAEHEISEHVHLVGEQSNIGDWMMMMQLYVNCSLSEGMSQSILEAMAMGLPIVATDVGANRRLVAGAESCGLVVPPASVEQLAGAIQQVVQSPELIRTLAANSRQRHSQDYGVDRMLNEYSELYRTLTHQGEESARVSYAAAGHFLR